MAKTLVYSTWKYAHAEKTRQPQSYATYPHPYYYHRRRTINFMSKCADISSVVGVVVCMQTFPTQVLLALVELSTSQFDFAVPVVLHLIFVAHFAQQPTTSLTQTYTYIHTPNIHTYPLHIHTPTHTYAHAHTLVATHKTTSVFIAFRIFLSHWISLFFATKKALNLVAGWTLNRTPNRHANKSVRIFFFGSKYCILNVTLVGWGGLYYSSTDDYARQHVFVSQKLCIIGVGKHDATCAGGRTLIWT